MSAPRDVAAWTDMSGESFPPYVNFSRQVQGDVYVVKVLARGPRKTSLSELEVPGETVTFTMPMEDLMQLHADIGRMLQQPMVHHPV